MKLTDLELRNFLSIKQVKLNLDDMGLVLLEGENKDNPGLDNNGSGKSSLIEGVVYALFGRTVRGLKADAVVHADAKKDCLVSLKVVDDNGDEYVIERNRKSRTNKNQSFLFLNGSDITPKSEAEVNAVIERIIGMDYATFCASTLYSAQSFPVTSATDSQLKALFESMLNLEIWSDAHDSVKASMRKCNESIINAEGERRVVRRRIEDAKTSRRETQEKAKLRAQEIAESEKLAQDNLETARKERRVLTRAEQRSRIAARTLADNVKGAESEIAALGESKLDAAKKAHSEAEYEVIVAEAALSKADALIDVEFGNKQRIQNNVERARMRVDEANRKESEVDGRVGSKCPVCGRPLTKEHLKAAKDEAHKAVVEAEKALESESAELEASEEKMQERVSASAKAEKALKASQETLQKAVDNLNAVRESEMKRTEFTERLSRLRIEKERADADLRVAGERVKAAAEKELNAETALEHLDRSNVYETFVKKLDDEITGLEAESEKIERELANLSSYETSLRFLDVAFGNGGIKSLLLDGVTPFLNERANFYLSKLAGDRIEVVFQTQTKTASGELRDKFGITVTNKDGGKSYAGNSGGEKKRVDLAVYLAFQDLLASRSVKKLNICLIDEAFDALDDSGMEGVVALLSEIAKERSTILVVTHSAALRQYFSNSLTMVKENGYSTLKE